MADNYRLPATPAGDPGTGPLVRSVDDGTAQHQAVRVSGVVSPAAVTGTITTTTSTVGGATDYGYLGNVTASITGTYAGVNAIFEVSDDGGTTWFPLAGQRVDNGVAEYTTGVLPANTTRMWMFPLAGANRFRVRATAWTSGTANVRISVSPILVDPVVAAIPTKPPTYVQTTFGTVTAGVAGSTTEALASLTPVRAGVAGSAATTHTPTAGKTFRATALSVSVANTAATQNAISAFLRGVPTGTATATSPILGFVGISAPNAVIGGMTGAVVPLDFDIPSGWSFGVSVDNAINSGTNWVYLMGYEY